MRRNSRASEAVTPPAPGWGMSNKPFLLRTLDKSYAAIGALAPLVRDVRKHDRPLTDQLRRAAQSITLNLAEAQGHSAGNRKLRLQSALGSTYETRAALTIATRWGYVSQHDATTALALLDEVAAMTHTMLRPRR